MNRETGWKKPAAKFLIFFYSCSHIKNELQMKLQTCIIETITAMSIIFGGMAMTVMYYVIVPQNLMTVTAWKNR